MKRYVDKAFRMLAVDILRLFLTVLSSDVGDNKDAKENSLKQSRLARTAETKAEAPFINLIVNDYIENIEKGTPPHTSKPSIDELRDWARKRGIPPTNDVLYAIRESIWQDGIKGRPIMQEFYKLLDKRWEEYYADLLLASILNNLNKFFNQ